MTDRNEPTLPDGESGLVRIRLDIAYDGGDFSGWATQPGRRTVQATLQDALETLFGLDRVALVVAGRTDAGVHAVGQVAHCDVPIQRWDEIRPTAIRSLTGILPPDVRVLSAARAPEHFDARFGAVWRHYRYRISDAAYGTMPLSRHDVAAWKHGLDAERMQRAAQMLLGLHEFAAFCRGRQGATTIRTLQELQVLRVEDQVIIDFRADAFCHSMVRSLVGALAAVGEGRRPVEWPASLLNRSRREDSVRVAPAHGLTLLRVGYPPDAVLLDRVQQSRMVRTAADSDVRAGDTRPS